MAMIMVGAPPNATPRSVSINSSTRAGSKASTGTFAARLCAAPSTPMPQPAVWNSGIGFTYTSPRRRPIRSTQKRALLVSPR